jgi:hypothetical protein
MIVADREQRLFIGAALDLREEIGKFLMCGQWLCLAIFSGRSSRKSTFRPALRRWRVGRILGQNTPDAQAAFRGSSEYPFKLCYRTYHTV